MTRTERYRAEHVDEVPYPLDDRLLDTNMTCGEYIACVEHLPRALTEIRRELRTEDIDLIEEWVSQIEWLMDRERFDAAFASKVPGHARRLMVAALRMLIPFALFTFACRFPRLAVALRLTR